MAKKKILLSAYSMDVGGIETALITLLKYLAPKYDITLVLERKQGVFLNDIPKSVKVLEYKVSDIKLALIRKPINFIKELRFKIKYHNKFDFAASYATYSMPGGFVARTASKNSALWVHNNYMNFYNNNKGKYIEYLLSLKIDKFKKIVFVSNYDKDEFCEVFSELKEKAVSCNNLIDYDKVINLSDEVDDECKELFKKIGNNEKVFINVGRHDEKQKRLTRIIDATRKLNKEGYKFKVIFVGKGVDYKDYINRAKDCKNIIFVGLQRNPYQYMKKSDCVVMSSDFEGYPVVFVESMILGLPIITTDISDSRSDVENKHGIIIEKSADGVYAGMKEFLDNGIKTEEFDAEKFNQEIIRKLEGIING